MKSEDAINQLIQFLRRCLIPRTQGINSMTSYGYDLYIPNLLRELAPGEYGSEDRPKMRDLSPHIYNAAWELARRGIIRPGVKTFDAQSTPDGSGGGGFSITPFGKQWLAESNNDTFIPTEPERFAEMLKPYATRFGAGFHERAQEAIRCYGAHAYLACCAMCGAATESIVLTAAESKYKDQEEMLKIYFSSGGRGKVETRLLGQAKEHIAREFKGLSTLLKYWRDEAAHGTTSGISENEAYTSLAMLLRLAKSVNDNWDELTGQT
jgi:hypothetical protein